MAPLLWLAVAIAAGVAAYFVGWPAWRAHRDREQLDLNAERYRAWRGRASPRPGTRREGMTDAERRRVTGAVALAGVAVIGFVAFFFAS